MSKDEEPRKIDRRSRFVAQPGEFRFVTEEELREFRKQVKARRTILEQRLTGKSANQETQTEADRENRDEQNNSDKSTEL